MRKPNPLQWPPGWTRATAREDSRFTVGLTTAVDTLFLEFERLGAINVVLTSDLPTRGDGRPYAAGRAQDPGIAVWFVMNDQERVFACDRWNTAAENIRAISSTVAALRGMARWGASEMMARAFAGFTALPAPAGTPRHWRDVLGVPPTDSTSVDLYAAERAWRKLSRERHPDVTGNDEAQIELNLAIQAARADLDPWPTRIEAGRVQEGT